MVRFLRMLIMFVSVISLCYAIYKYIEAPSSLYYIMGGSSALLAAIASYVEMKSKKSGEKITSGNNSTIVNINGNRNKTKVSNKNEVK